MSGRFAIGDAALSGQKGTGTHRSDPLAAGYTSHVILAVHVTAVSGTSPTLAVSLEESDDGQSWTAVPNGGPATLTAAGNAMSNAAPTKSLCRVVAVVGGTATPTATFTASVLTFAA